MKLLLVFSQMTKRTFPFALAMLCAACAHAQVVATNDLHLGYIGQPYVGQMTATGGTEPYTWSVSGGALPAGMSLSSGGALGGTPMAGGTFSVTIQVTDNAGSTANKPFSLQIFDQPTDQYGGLINKPCTNGPRAHFYTQKMGNRWYLCTPAGNAFWMSNVCAISTDVTADYQGVSNNALIGSKYATGLTANPTDNWALQIARRLQSWGFTAVGTFSTSYILPGFIGVAGWPAPDHTIPVKLPYVMLSNLTVFSLSNRNNYAPGYTKDLMNGISTSVYNGNRATVADMWDNNWASYISGSLTHDTYGVLKALTNPHNDYFIGVEVDNMDNMGGFGAGPDFNRVVDGTMIVSPSAYASHHLGWIALVTAPTQTSNSSLNVTYTDRTVYTKQQFISFMTARYSNDISALNAAWGSNYTTFGASGGGFGLGTGLTDENGLCPAKMTTCWVPTNPVTLAGATATMKADLDAFLLYHAQHYFSTVKAAVNAAVPGILYLGTTGIGSWGAPPRAQILQAARAYCDVITIADIPPTCTNCTGSDDIQHRIDFMAQYGGDKPWIDWRGLPANPDSYESPWKTQENWLQTQVARGQYYQNTFVPQTFNSCDTPTGTCHMVGSQWWALYDSRSERLNWGLATPRDDPYDGVSATTTQGYDAWGYPTGCVPGYGCEQGSYGDFISHVRAGNLWALDQLAGTPPPTTTINLTTSPH